MPSEPFPLFFPRAAPRFFVGEELLRRLAKLTPWASGARILDLCGGPASIILARELGCAVTAAEVTDEGTDQLKELIRSQQLQDRIEVKKISLSNLPFAASQFDGIVALGRVPMRLSAAVKDLRRFLAPKGRLALTYPVKVGRFPLKAAVDFWEARLGEPLMLPREVLHQFQKTGYEPETVETLNDSELNDYYRALEPMMAAVPPGEEAEFRSLTDEFELHRSQAGKASITLAFAVGRRKESGEKPPASRDVG